MLERFNAEVELVDAPIVETPAVEVEAPEVTEDMIAILVLCEAEEVVETPAEEVVVANEEVLVEVVEIVDVAC